MRQGDIVLGSQDKKLLFFTTIYEHTFVDFRQTSL